MDNALHTTIVLGAFCNTLGTITFMFIKHKKIDNELEKILTRLALAEKNIKEDKFNFKVLEKLLEKFENDRERILHLTTQVAALLNGEKLERMIRKPNPMTET